MTEPRYAVGIDLGTTHCAVASAPLDRPSVHLMAIPQLVAPTESASRPLLPSFMYLPADGELPEGARKSTTDDLSLPPHVVGELAVRLGAKSPNRLVASAKSWICHGGVNRRAPILPWNSPEDQPHVSPLDAQVAYLAHIRAAWEDRYTDVLRQQDVVVTVPASFDAGARELTTQAAMTAGLGDVRLLEEPQAAFYDFLGATPPDTSHDALEGAGLILVIDVGGGTTDLTLLKAGGNGSDEGTRIERIAVGGHLMLGGDNMDAALATFALTKAGIDRPTDATVWSALVQSARLAKEQLLSEDAPAEAVVTYQGRGSRLISGTKSIAISREEAGKVLLDGFLPHTSPAEVAQRASRAGLTTLGLPYATDAAIGRHVCTFLRRHADAAREAGAAVIDGLPKPDRLLLNGGVFNAPAMIHRLGEVLTQWFGESVPLLEHTSLNTAVARGAVRSALARRGLGELIGGGTARAYYVGIDDDAGERQALCIAPRAMQDGDSVEVPNQVFELLLDQPVVFPLYAYTGDRVDEPGAVVQISDDLDEVPSVETVLRAKEQASRVPVTLAASMSETGALELYLATVELPPRRWKLDFVLGNETVPPPPVATDSPAAPGLDEARGVFEHRLLADDVPAAPASSPRPEKRNRKGARGSKNLKAAKAPTSDSAVKQLRSDLEKLLGPRGQWSADTCRALGQLCLEFQDARGRSEAHELHWMRLVGWCLRPGVGVDGDAARVDSMWAVREQGLRCTSKANWSQWWVMWRRLAAGLNADRQRELFEEVRPFLWRDTAPPPGPHRHGPGEMMQLLGALERLSSSDKQKCGDLLLERGPKIGSYWPLGRVGSRELFHGDPTDVVGADVAERWLSALLQLDWSCSEGASFAAASIARRTGDSNRDIDDALRKKVADRLRKADAPATWTDMVLRTQDLSDGDLKRVLGDSLPAGLRLRRQA